MEAKPVKHAGLVVNLVFFCPECKCSRGFRVNTNKRMQTVLDEVARLHEMYGSLRCEGDFVITMKKV